MKNGNGTPSGTTGARRKTRRTALLAAASALLAAASVLAARETPLHNGRLSTDLNAGGHAVTNLAPPSASSDAATRGYVDAAVANAAPADYADVSSRAMSAVQPDALAPYAKRTEVPTKVGALTNDAGYLTGAQVKPDEDNPGWAKNARSAAYAEEAHNSTYAGYASAVEWENISSKPDLASASSVESVASNLADHTSSTANPHKVTAAQVGAYTKGETDSKVSEVDVREQLSGYVAKSEVVPSETYLGFAKGSEQALRLAFSPGSETRIGFESLDGYAFPYFYGGRYSAEKNTILLRGDVNPSSNNTGNAANADHALTADSAGSADTADAVPWDGVTGKPDVATKSDVDTAVDGLASEEYVNAKVETAADSIDTKLSAKQDRPAATATAAALSLRADGAAISVSVAASGTLSASLGGWTDGQAQTALISLAPGASVAAAVSLVGYGSWPTNRFVASCVRVGPRVYVTPITALAE